MIHNVDLTPFLGLGADLDANGEVATCHNCNARHARAPLAFDNVLGAIAHTASAVDAMITCALAVGVCALVALLVPAIRRISV